MKKRKEVQTQKELKGWQLLKAIWKNKRYKAMIKLGGYLIFMIAVILYIQLNKPSLNTNYEVMDPLKKYASYDNYQYQYTLTQNQSVQVVNGIRINNQELFQIDGTNEKYLLEENKVYLLSELGKQNVPSPIQYSLLNVRPSNLKSIIDSSQRVATTNYEDGSKMLTYSITASDFYQLYNKTDVLVDADIEIKVTIENNTVTKILLDLTPAMKLLNPSYYQVQFEFTYLNIGQMREL